jgi:deazaflavin-dependent oxidoreductase (nitroreductase family)
MAMHAGSPLLEGHSRRPLLGLRADPGRLALAIFRSPLRRYQHGWGWMLGRTFLVLTHVGRKTGRPHDTAAMVLTYDPATRESVICSAWGPDTDWIRNIRVHPATQVRIGREAYTPEQRFLTDDEAFAVALKFRRDHPWRLRLLSAILGWGDLRVDDATRAFITTRPFVAFRPTANTTS